jgi:hypothetical protein
MEIFLPLHGGKDSRRSFGSGQKIKVDTKSRPMADKIVEIKPQGERGGKIVWEWHIWDHLIQDYDSKKGNYGNPADHLELIDLNVEDTLPAPISHFIIDHSTTTKEAASHKGGRWGKGGDFLYRWGNPQNYHHGDSTDRKLFHQHDIRWIEKGKPGAGNLRQCCQKWLVKSLKA